eukprot:gene2396-1499_t
MGWKKEMHKKRKGKEKQLFRGIFAFIANRDLFAQSDFYFFHDSTLMMVSPARPPQKPATQPRRCRRQPASIIFDGARENAGIAPAAGGEENICVEAIDTRFSGIIAAHLGPREMHKKRKRKEKQLFRGIFAFIANRDLFAQSDFYFSTIHARHAGARKIVQVEKNFDGGFMPRAPPQKPATQPRRCRRQPAPIILTALGKTRELLQRRKGEENICVEAIEPTRFSWHTKQLFRGIFAFIANRDLFAQSDFYFSTIRYAPPCRRQKIVQVEKNF